MNKTLPANNEINRSAMARAIHVDVAHVSRILSGKRNPSLAVASRMADYLGITLDDLFRVIAEGRD